MDRTVNSWSSTATTYELAERIGYDASSLIGIHFAFKVVPPAHALPSAIVPPQREKGEATRKNGASAGHRGGQGRKQTYLPSLVASKRCSRESFVLFVSLMMGSPFFAYRNMNKN
jgi:hypothetical protein